MPKVFVSIGVGLFLLLATWLVWAMWLHSGPRVTSQLVAWRTVDDHVVTATVNVDIHTDATDVDCTLRAYAEDHRAVGDKTFVPVDGRNDVTFRVERRATAIDSLGCTAEGQDNAR